MHSTATQTKTEEVVTEKVGAFDETYRDWIAVQRQDLDKYGLWCDGIVAW